MEIKPKSKTSKSDVQQYSDVVSSDELENDNKNPTPHERAELVVRRLEDFIRKGRTDDGGINFRKWQEMAAVEVADAIRDAERYLRSDQRFWTRSMAVGAASLLTIGVWGTVLAADATADRQMTALILIITGVLLLGLVSIWAVRRMDHYYKKGRRRYHLKRIIDFDRKLATLDKEMENRIRNLQESLREMTKGSLGKL